MLLRILFQACDFAIELGCSHKNQVLVKYRAVESSAQVANKHGIKTQEVRLPLTQQYWHCLGCGKNCGCISDYSNKVILT